MINYHPDTRMLNEFTAGSLPLAQSACVSLHLNYCSHCQRESRKLQQMGGALFERLAPCEVSPSVLDSVMARLDEPAPLRYESTAAVADESPALMRRLMKGDYKDLEWDRISSGLQISKLHTGDSDNEFALYHIKAGRTIPRHTHKGTELTLVLEGSFSDEEGVYQRGDFLMRDAAHEHTPTAAKSEDCICIGVLDAPIKFTGWNYRVLNPFLSLQAH